MKYSASNCNLDRFTRRKNCDIVKHLARVCGKARANFKQLKDILQVEHIEHRETCNITVNIKWSARRAVSREE
ncbi:hypothetical protein QLX08_003988 [Tetragonisca angustula]|uniref:Uncharacterized protein n=1 Tax=Tetragonisca angustula TaxID=166442 RepID=A0AAW1A6E2_9HYME